VFIRVIRIKQSVAAGAAKPIQPPRVHIHVSARGQRRCADCAKFQSDNHLWLSPAPAHALHFE
jgi:hypothetical protein